MKKYKIKKNSENSDFSEDVIGAWFAEIKQKKEENKYTWFRNHDEFLKYNSAYEKLSPIAFKDYHDWYKKAIDIQNKLFFAHQTGIDMAGTEVRGVSSDNIDEDYLYAEKRVTIMFTAFLKNLLTIQSAIILTNKGLYGPARILLRNIFEFLLIAKFVSITHKLSLIKKWDESGNISVSKEVFRKISKPDIKELKKFWSLLCKYSHSTIQSVQGSMDLRKETTQIRLNYVFILLLLECNYHLLNTHILSDSSKYYTLEYSGEAEKIQKLRQDIKNLFKQINKKNTKGTKSLIYTYKRTWHIK